MTDEKTVQPGQQAAPSGAQETFDSGKPKHHRAFISAGERMHGVLTYAGADWIMNSAIGVTFTFIFNRTKFGQNYISKPLESGFRFVFSPFIKNEKLLRQSINGGKDFASIMLGGTLVNPMITALEKHENKLAITKAIDNTIYGKDKTDSDPKFQKAYREIQTEPVKDTSGVWISRAIAIAPLWTATFFPSAMRFMESNQVPLLKYINFDHIAGFTQGIAKTLHIKPKGWWNETKLNPTTNKQVSHWDALHGYLGFDYGLTIFYAILHAVSFNLVARFMNKHTDGVPQKDAQHPHAATPRALVSETEQQQTTPEKPTTRIAQVETLSRVGADPSLQATV